MGKKIKKEKEKVKTRLKARKDEWRICKNEGYKLDVNERKLK